MYDRMQNEFLRLHMPDDVIHCNFFRIWSPSTYRDGHARNTSANEERKLIFHIDDGPKLEDEKIDVYVKDDV